MSARPAVIHDRYAARQAARRRVSGASASHYGRASETMVATDPPSPPVALYRGCLPGCGCLRCRLDAELEARQYEACAPFREMAW